MAQLLLGYTPNPKSPERCLLERIFNDPILFFRLINEWRPGEQSVWFTNKAMVVAERGKDWQLHQEQRRQ